MQYTGNTIKLGTKLTNSSGCLDFENFEIDKEFLKTLKKNFSNKPNKKLNKV